jgi:hypothetical protein
VYSNYDQEKFKDCLAIQMKDIDDHEKDGYKASLSRNFLDRDYNQRHNVSLDFLPCISVNGECHQVSGPAPDTNQLFKLICSKLRDRPEACKDTGIAFKKGQIKKEYEEEWGAEGTVERAVITLDKIKEKQQQDQDDLAIQDKTTTKAVLLSMILSLILATVCAFYCKNRRDRAKVDQAMHDAINS